MDKDTIYSMPLAKVGDFRFDEQVVQVFPDMIERSVPGYGSILSMIGELAARYVGEGSHVYDLGCSLGACTKVIRGRIPANCHIHAIGSSQAMIESLRRALEPSEDLATVEVEKADIRDVTIDKASLCVLNFGKRYLREFSTDSISVEPLFYRKRSVFLRKISKNSSPISTTASSVLTDTVTSRSLKKEPL